MDLKQDIACIVEQEKRLVFPAFDNTTAWALGTGLRSLAESRGVAVTVEIRLVRETVFFCAMPGTGPSNADWARRKRNSVDLLQRSSYLIGLELQRDNTTLEQKLGLSLRDHAFAGGCFPLRVAGVGMVGTVTVSGLPQREDHNLVVEVVAQMLGMPLAEVALA